MHLIIISLGKAITKAKGHEPTLYEALCFIAGPFLDLQL